MVFLDSPMPAVWRPLFPPTPTPTSHPIAPPPYLQCNSYLSFMTPKLTSSGNPFRYPKNKALSPLCASGASDALYAKHYILSTIMCFPLPWWLRR